LLENQAAFFRYLQIRKKISAIYPQKFGENGINKVSSRHLSTYSLNGLLPFLDLPIKEIKKNKVVINEQEYKNLGLYLSYFSRWQEISQKTDYQPCSLLEVFSKIEEYDNQEKVINIYAIICQIEKKDQNNYVFLLQDIRNSFKLNIKTNICQAN
jgi:hypothetical protein